MPRLKILQQIIVRTHVNQLLAGYVFFIAVVSGIITFFEPEIHGYGDALWYCYACITTVGFGDVLVTTWVSKLLSVILSIYSVLIIAIVTGVVVNFYNQMIQIRQEETLSALVDKLQRLPEMSKEELTQFSSAVQEFQNKKKYHE